MKAYQASSLDVEVSGKAVLAIVEGVGNMREQAEEILANNNMKPLREDLWYGQQDWLDAFKEIVALTGDRHLVEIGRQIPRRAAWPDVEAPTVHAALESIDRAYKLNHRGGEIGEYKYTREDERHGTMTCTNPYPDLFDKGIIEGAASYLAGRDVKVVIDTTHHQREQGGESTTYDITW